MLKILVVLCGFSLASLVAKADDTRVLEVDGIQRFYYVHVPPGYDASQALPVVVFYHGGIRNADSARRAYGWNQKADRENFIVVYPNGRPRRRKIIKNWKHLFWNSNPGLFSSNADDITFTRAFLADLQNNYAVDGNRIYATGVSNGAQMAYRAACELTGTFAAVAPSSGSLETYPCSPSRPISVLDIHGTADRIIPFNGNGALHYNSQPSTVASWVQMNGCETTPNVSQMPTIVNDGTVVQVFDYPGCQSGVEVTAVVVYGGGHTWPGMPMEYPYAAGEYIRARWLWKINRKILGPVSHQFDATDYVWDFFSRH